MTYNVLSGTLNTTIPTYLRSCGLGLQVYVPSRTHYYFSYLLIYIHVVLFKFSDVCILFKLCIVNQEFLLVL